MSSVLVAGELIVDFHPATTGSLADVESFSKRPGGAPANVAVGLARLDTPARLWTRVGDDAFGDFLVDAVVDAGIDPEHVTRDPEASTGLAFVSLGADADREFQLYLDGTASSRLEPGAVDPAGFDWVHVGGVELAHEPARTAVFDLAERARDAGATVSFDPNARPELWGEFDYADTLDRMLGLADVVTASPEDLAPAGYDADPAELARSLCGAGPHTAFVTLGAEGALGHATADAPWGPAEERHAGYVVDAVDATGAGDAFTAGVVAALSRGESLAAALGFANAVAALTTREQGAMAALPTREEVARFRS